jgi:hypothetical protein
VKRLFFFILTFGLTAIPAGSGLALSIDSSGDCDSNAVINCGLTDTSDASSAYQRSGVSDIYADFGISSQDMSSLSDTAVSGVVTNNNNVWIHRSSGLCPDVDASTLSSHNQQAVKDNPNLCLVATNAMTAGRQNISGSTKMANGGTVYYMRPPSVSFRSSSLPAFVVMDNDRFTFAIIASCGNPVKAAPVTAVKPKVKAAATTVRPTTAQPPAVTQSQTQSQSQTLNITQPPAVTQTTAAPAPAGVPAKTLPNTGPGGILGLGGISAVIGTIGHLVYTRRRSAVA